MKSTPTLRIATVDIETSNFNADWGIIICASIKWNDTKKVQEFRMDKYPTWKTDRANDKPLVKDLVTALENADIIVAHNGGKFDRPFINTKCILYGIPPSLRHKKFIDPVMVSRKHLKLGRNSLAALSGFLGTDTEKTPIISQDWLHAVINGDTKALDRIVKHCNNDVLVLEQVLVKILPLIGDINTKGSWF